MELFTRKRQNISIAIILLALSFLFCIFDRSWEYMSRVGSLITVLGLICMERRNLRLGPDMVFHYSRSSLDDETAPITADMKLDEFMNGSEDVSSLYWGILLIAIGTVLWGYGDVLFGLFYSFNNT